MRGLKGVVQCNVLTGDSTAGNSKPELLEAQKPEVTMKETLSQETTKTWNIKNLILHGIELAVFVAALVLHPIYETKPVRALP